ncbi:MAG: hypothetical protein LH606_20065 [Cytophagaceae bacterium]|nr:hypothetical protein [Cytophagaceae bacterium]
MNRLFTLIFLSGWLLASSAALAQLEQVQRMEFDLPSQGDEEYEVLTLGSDGVLVTRKKTEYYAGTPLQWHFTKYDMDLKTVWETDLKVKASMQPLLTYHNGHYLYWLFGEVDSEKINILRLHLDTGDQELIEGELLAVSDVSHFKVLGNTAFVAGHYRDRAVVVRFDFFSRQSRVLPGLYVNHLEVSSLEVDETINELSVTVTTTRRGRCQLSLRTYSYEGKLLQETALPGEEGRTMLSGKVVPLGKGESLLVGTYSANCSPYAQGVYVARTGSLPNEADRTAVKYLEFSQFKNFFNYLKPSRRQRVMERIARKKDEGKEAHFRYLMLVHDLIPTADGFLLVAEAYFPQYRNASASLMPFGRPGADRSLDGFRYTHALIGGFDKTGKLLWDNSFAMPDVMSYELEEQVQVTQQANGQLVLAYPVEDKINTIVLRGSEVLREKEELELAPKTGLQRILSTENTSLAAWHNHYFLAWGIQRKAADRANPARDVFYLNKLSYPLR